MLPPYEKQVHGRWGKGVCPYHHDSFSNSTSQVQEFPVVWPTHDVVGSGQYIIKAGTRAQPLTTLEAAGAKPSPQNQTQVTPGRNTLERKMGKAVAAVMALLLISMAGAKGKEILPKTLITNCQCECWWGKILCCLKVQQITLCGARFYSLVERVNPCKTIWCSQVQRLAKQKQSDKTAGAQSLSFCISLYH